MRISDWSSDVCSSVLIEALCEGAATDLVRQYIPVDSVEEQWDVPALEQSLAADWQIHLPLSDMLDKEASLTDDDIPERGLEAVRGVYTGKIAQAIGRAACRQRVCQ